MAAAGARNQKPVGSAAWVSTEKENVAQLVDQELEEVQYPVSHEMDWLNEHMAEIFNNNQLCVATVALVDPLARFYADCRIAISPKFLKRQGRCKERLLAPCGNGT